MVAFKVLECSVQCLFQSDLKQEADFTINGNNCYDMFVSNVNALGVFVFVCPNLNSVLLLCRI